MATLSLEDWLGILFLAFFVLLVAACIGVAYIITRNK